MIEPSQEISMLNMFNNCQNVEMVPGAYRETQKGGGETEGVEIMTFKLVQ